MKLTLGSLPVSHKLTKDVIITETKETSRDTIIINIDSEEKEAKSMI